MLLPGSLLDTLLLLRALASLIALLLLSVLLLVVLALTLLLLSLLLLLSVLLLRVLLLRRVLLWVCLLLRVFLFLLRRLGFIFRLLCVHRSSYPEGQRENCCADKSNSFHGCYLQNWLRMLAPSASFLLSH